MIIRVNNILMPIILLLLISTSAAGNTREIVFATESWAAATEKDGTGLYWDIMRSVYEPEGIKVRWVIKSYAAAVKLIEMKKADAVIGAYASEIDNAIYPEYHFALDVVKAVAPQKKNIKWIGEKSLADKKVGWIKGYSFENYLDVSLKKYEIYNRKTALKVLDRGRIDFYLDAAADLSDYLKKHPEENNKFDQWILKKLKLYVAFRNDAKGQTLAQIFDRRFGILLKNGTINKLYDTYINDKQANFTNPFPRTDSKATTD